MKSTEEDTFETWASNVRARVGVARWDRDGARSIELVHPGSALIITTAERIRNQSIVIKPADDPFTNGAFSLKDAPDLPAPEREKLAKNPAALSDEDIEKILSGGTKAAFEKKINGFDSPVVLHRLYAEARAQSIGGDRLKIIRERLGVLEPNGTLPGDHIVVGKEIAPEGSQTVAEMESGFPGGPRQYAGAP